MRLRVINYQPASPKYPGGVTRNCIPMGLDLTRQLRKPRDAADNARPLSPFPFISRLTPCIHSYITRGSHAVHRAYTHAREHANSACGCNMDTWSARCKLLSAPLQAFDEKTPAQSTRDRPYGYAMERAIIFGPG